MAYSEDYLTFITDQLEGIENIFSKRMFGGVGYFKDDKMFGAIMGGLFRLKADEHTVHKYEKYGIGPFQMEGKPMKMPYYEVPQSVLEDKKELKNWVNEAIEAAERTKKPKKKK